MNLGKLILATTLVLPLALGQTQDAAPGSILTVDRQIFEDRAVVRPPAVAYQELKSFLQLSDTQVDALLEIQKAMREETGKISQEIAEKNRALQVLLENGSTDYARIGLLIVEINQLHKKLPIRGEPYRSQALAVLTRAQVEKLQDLVAALRLASPAYQAVALNLIDHPQDHQPRPLPMPMPVVNGQN
jgi:hypothetical protein